MFQRIVTKAIAGVLAAALFMAALPVCAEGTAPYYTANGVSAAATAETAATAGQGGPQDAPPYPATPETATEVQCAALLGSEEMVDANILLGLTPRTNSQNLIQGGGDGTASGIYLKNPAAATDGNIEDADSDTGYNTEIVAGQEKASLPNNGWDTWTPVYLEYDFGKLREVKSVEIYRNTYPAARSTFKDVKVELSEAEDFSDKTVIFDTADVKEENRGECQTITLEQSVTARYLRVWQRGHYIENDNSGWKGMSAGNRFNEIRVIASVPQSEVPVPPAEGEKQNIALGKLPYVRGLTPTNLKAITDGKFDDNYAVHNSLGKRWLQFEFKNRYDISEIRFQLEPGHYKSVEVYVSANPTQQGTQVFFRSEWDQNDKPVSVTVDPKGAGRRKQYVRFVVNRADNQPARYSEVQIWATGTSYDESKPDYQAPESEYDTLVWSDEFDGDQLDESKWQVIEGMANHGAIYNREAVSVRDGCLVINSKNYGTTQELIDAVGWDQYGSQTLNTQKVTWSSGRVESKNRYSFQFGRVAVRAKPNDSQGIWPAIWMLCQDETGHDEIDILEYLGQDSWQAWTTNHYGILNLNKGSNGIATANYEAWCQDFHVFEVEWDPQQIRFFIDGKQVHSTTAGRDKVDGMHTRPMFMILETQVGDGWVGDVDYTRQETKQDSNFLIDWVRVYQKSGQPVARFDDLGNIYSGPVEDDYLTAPVAVSDGLKPIHHEAGTVPAWQDKDNFFYGGQPRVETDRVAVAEDAGGEQYLLYRVPRVKDVHLTTYYQTLSDGNRHNPGGGDNGTSIRGSLQDGKTLDFQLYTSTDGASWTSFTRMKTVENYVDAYPGYARVTFDAYGLPEGTNYVKVVFPDCLGVQYRLMNSSVQDVCNTDVQLAKVTFLQAGGVSDRGAPTFAADIQASYAANSGAGAYLPFSTVQLEAGQREGYTFSGWKVLQGNVTLADAAAAQTTFTMPAGAVKIVAQWSATVRPPQPENGGSADNTAQNNSTGEVKPENTPTPTQGPADAALSTAVPVPPGGTSAPAVVAKRYDTDKTPAATPEPTPTETEEPVEEEKASAPASTATPTPMEEKPATAQPTPAPQAAQAGVPAWLYVLIPLLAVLLGGLLFLWKKWKN